MELVRRVVSHEKERWERGLGRGGTGKDMRGHRFFFNLTLRSEPWRATGFARFVATQDARGRLGEETRR